MTSDEESVCWLKEHIWARQRLDCWPQWAWLRSASTSSLWWPSCPPEMRYKRRHILTLHFYSCPKRPLFKGNNKWTTPKLKTTIDLRVQILCSTAFRAYLYLFYFNSTQTLSLFMCFNCLWDLNERPVFTHVGKVELKDLQCAFKKTAPVCARAAPESGGWPSPRKD